MQRRKPEGKQPTSMPVTSTEQHFHPAQTPQLWKWHFVQPIIAPRCSLEVEQ